MSNENEVSHLRGVIAQLEEENRRLHRDYAEVNNEKIALQHKWTESQSTSQSAKVSGASTPKSSLSQEIIESLKRSQREHEREMNELQGELNEANLRANSLENQLKCAQKRLEATEETNTGNASIHSIASSEKTSHFSLISEIDSVSTQKVPEYSEHIQKQDAPMEGDDVQTTLDSLVEFRRFILGHQPSERLYVQRHHKQGDWMKQPDWMSALAVGHQQTYAVDETKKREYLRGRNAMKYAQSEWMEPTAMRTVNSLPQEGQSTFQMNMFGNEQERSAISRQTPRAMDHVHHALNFLKEAKSRTASDISMPLAASGNLATGTLEKTFDWLSPQSISKYPI